MVEAYGLAKATNGEPDEMAAAQFLGQADDIVRENLKRNFIVIDSTATIRLSIRSDTSQSTPPYLHPIVKSVAHELLMTTPGAPIGPSIRRNSIQRH